MKEYAKHNACCMFETDSVIYNLGLNEINPRKKISMLNYTELKRRKNNYYITSEKVVPITSVLTAIMILLV